jgi:hypothetical protein
MTRSRHLLRHAALAGLAAASVLGLAACGDDGGDGGDGDEGAAEGAGVCEARDELTESFAALGDIDVVNDGTDAVRAAVDSIGEDLEALREAAGDEADDELDAVGAAVDDLRTAVGDLGGESVGAVGTALADLSVALGDLVLALAQDCD